MSSRNLRHAFAAVGTVLAATVAFAMPTPGLALQPVATPGPSYSCETVGSVAATPSPETESMTEMAMGSPMADEMGIDLLYIDMMIPHHGSIIAMAEAALPRLTDERLQEIARTIIATQSGEIAELTRLREELSGSSMPMSMDQQHMGMMMEMMPGMGSMADMAEQMDPVTQVRTICEASNVDLAFIDLTIPHHDMAIMASEAVLEQSSNEKIRAFAERVIADQQSEIDALREIRQDQ